MNGTLIGSEVMALGRLLGSGPSWENYPCVTCGLNFTLHWHQKDSPPSKIPDGGGLSDIVLRPTKI